MRCTHFGVLGLLGEGSFEQEQEFAHELEDKAYWLKGAVVVVCVSIMKVLDFYGVFDFGSFNFV